MRELRRELIPHLQTPYGSTLLEDTSFGIDLPYQSLLGPGFERLCYHLLLCQGKTPRFFGKSGQAQYGIDLIISDGASCEVFQCKNVAGFGPKALGEALVLFEEQWRHPTPGFPLPNSFTICTSERIDDRDDWEEVKSKFYDRTNIRVYEWDRTYLNTSLRRHPDVVADFFGDAVAERFCDDKDWNDGLWLRLLPDNDRTLDRFLELEGDGRIVLGGDLTNKFENIFRRQGTILVEGSSGVGKTLTGLALAKSTGQRIIYLTIEPNFTSDFLFAGISSRLSRDTIFILDDCHRNWQAVESASWRVRRALRGRPYTLIFVAQTSPPGMEMVETGAVEYVEELRDAGMAIRIESNLKRFSQVLRTAFPDWRNATDSQIESMHRLAAGNLAVLNLLIKNAAKADEIDKTIEDLASELARSWFGTSSPVAPALHRFSSIAQFDLTIQAGTTWPDPEMSNYAGAIDRFVLRYGDPKRNRPPVWRFSHAREAELVSRVLSAVSGRDWRKQAVSHACDHLVELSGNIDVFAETLHRLLSGRLSLADDHSLKDHILTNQKIEDLVKSNIENVPLRTLSLAADVLSKTGSIAQYDEVLARKLETIFVATENVSSDDIAWLGRSLKTLGIVNEPKLIALLSGVSGKPVLDFILKHGTLLELFDILNNSNFDFAASLLVALDETYVSELVDQTIASGRSIGMLNSALRGLAARNMPDGPPQLDALEPLIGGATMLHLIRERGTLFELFSVLKNSTPRFAASLIDGLDAAFVSELVDQTIASGRSIGTLSFTLRDLATQKMPDGQSQLDALESLIGGATMLHLIRESGTLFELFSILKDSTPGFAASLIVAVDAAFVSDLVDKTIESGRSIATLHLTLRDLATQKMPDGQSQLDALESLIGGATMLHLIQESGSLMELFKTLEYSTPGFAASLIVALDAAFVSELVDKTIASGRSIGTLNLALRDLATQKMPDGQSQLDALESLIGGTTMLHLVRERGTLFELFRILQDSSPGFAASLIVAVDAAFVNDLVDATIAAERSIGTLSFTLRDLATQKMPDGQSQLDALESLIGGTTMLHLIRERGTLFDLFRILQYSTPGFAASLLVALDAAFVSELIDKTIAAERSIGTLSYTFRALSSRPWSENLDQRHVLESKIPSSEFWRLIGARGDLSDLTYLINVVSEDYRIDIVNDPAVLDSDLWRLLLKQGSFFDLCHFCAEGLNHFQHTDRGDFLDTANVELSRLLDAASWSDISFGLGKLSEAKQLRIARDVECAVENKVANTDLTSLKGLDFVEAVSAIVVLWKHAPDIHAQMAEMIEEILPDKVEWPQNYKLLNTGQLLMPIISDECFSPKAVGGILAAFWPNVPSAAVEISNGQVLFGFLWNLQGCLIFWNGRNGLPRAGVFSSNAETILLDRLAKLSDTAKDNYGKIGALEFAGAMLYYFPILRHKIDAAVRGKIHGFKWLLEETMTLRFVPAVFCFTRPYVSWSQKTGVVY